jgi:hypothetical protein
MEDKLLTFEISRDCDEIEIHGDEKGLGHLIELITKVLEYRQHDHWMTPSWGGDELSEELQNPENKIINKVTLHIW